MRIIMRIMRIIIRIIMRIIMRIMRIIIAKNKQNNYRCEEKHPDRCEIHFNVLVIVSEIIKAVQTLIR